MTAAPATTIEHVIGTSGAVSLHVRSADVRLRAVEGDTVRVRSRDERDLRRIDAEHGPGLLVLRASAGVDALEVEVPRDATVLVEGSSGDIAARGLRADQRYRTSSGDIQLDEVGGRLTAEAVSGDVRIVAVGSVEVSARTVSGDLAIQAGTIATLRAVTTSGDLRLAGRFEGDGPFSVETVSGDATLAPAGDLGVTVTTITGDVRSDVDAHQEGPRGRRTIRIGRGLPALEFRSTSGDLRLARAVTLPVAPPRPVTLPSPPAPPIPPSVEEIAPMSTTDPAEPARTSSPDEAVQLDILRALERGDIDVAEATRRLAALTHEPAPESDHAG